MSAESFDIKKLLNKDQAADYLTCSKSTLNRYLGMPGAGLRRIRYLGRVYFDPKDLEAFRRSLVEVRTQ